jgi:hypothetical protein
MTVDKRWVSFHPAGRTDVPRLRWRITRTRAPLADRPQLLAASTSLIHFPPPLM